MIIDCIVVILLLLFLYWFIFKRKKFLKEHSINDCSSCNKDCSKCGKGIKYNERK